MPKLAALLLFVQLGNIVTKVQPVTGQCVDLVQDCGGKADNHTDNAQAFAVCQHLASQRSGCITVPAGLFRMSPVSMNTSHTEIRVSNDAVFLPWLGIEKPAPALFMMGNIHPTTEDYVQNISIHGEAPGHFTVDLSTALYDTWQLRGFGYWAGIKNFLLANMLCRQANPLLNNQTKYRSNIACIEADHETVNNVRLNPQDGVFENLTCLQCTFGYGLMQLRSAERVSARNLYTEGGVALRLETGGGPGGYLGDIVGENITCKNGQAAVMSAPHVLQNGVYHIRDVVSLGCFRALTYDAGYSEEGYPPGFFSNASTVANVVAYYGTQAQNSSLDVPVPACSACTSNPQPRTYKVTLTNFTAIGFPPPSNRTSCVTYIKSHGCPYQ